MPCHTTMWSLCSCPSLSRRAGWGSATHTLPYPLPLTLSLSLPLLLTHSHIQGDEAVERLTHFAYRHFSRGMLVKDRLLFAFTLVLQVHIYMYVCMYVGQATLHYTTLHCFTLPPSLPSTLLTPVHTLSLTPPQTPIPPRPRLNSVVV